eukprot:2133142-Rhodomonas_salina.1
MRQETHLHLRAALILPLPLPTRRAAPAIVIGSRRPAAAPLEEKPPQARRVAARTRPWECG